MVFQYTAHYHICDAYHRAANIQMGFSHAAYTCTLNTFDASYSFAKEGLQRGFDTTCMYFRSLLRGFLTRLAK